MSGIMPEVGVSPELEPPWAGRCREETCSQDQERDPVSPARHRPVLSGSGTQEGTCSTSPAGAPPVGTKGPRETPLPLGCANPIQSQTPASSTGATAGSGQLLPTQGSSGFAPEAEALSQAIYQLKEPFVLT